MSLINESSSFLSQTLKRRQQKRHEVTKVLEEGISSLHLSSNSHEQQKSSDGVYPLFNIDPDSYLLEEGDERSILEPNSYSNPDFKQTIQVLLNWMNTSLKKDMILVRSLEDDLYDGYILGKLIEFYQPNIRLLDNEIPLSEESKKMLLKRVLNYLDICLNQSIKWTFEQIFNRDFIAILHLLLALIRFLNKKSVFDLPKTLLLKVIVVKKINGILQTQIRNECFIDDHDRELTCTASPQYGDLIDTLFDLAPEKLSIVEKTFVNFLNLNFARYHIHIKQIQIEDFQDGLYLLYLVSHLENYFLILNKYHQKKPITREQSYGNLQLAFQLLNQAGIDIDQYCRINDILAGDQRTLYRLLFQIYLRFNSDSNNLLQSINYLQPIRANADSPFL